MTRGLRGKTKGTAKCAEHRRAEGGLPLPWSPCFPLSAALDSTLDQRREGQLGEILFWIAAVTMAERFVKKPVAGEAPTPASGISVVPRPEAHPPSFPPAPRRLGLMLLATAILVLVSHPVVWGWSGPGLWFPPVGFALAALIWLGWPVLPVIFVAIGVVEVISPLNPSIGVGLAESALATLELGLGWWCYIRQARGRRRLNDPRSAILFLLLVPFMSLGLGSVLRCLLHESTLSWPWVLSYWSQHVVGVLALAPLMLVGVTGWLTAQELVPADPLDEMEDKLLLGGRTPEGRPWGDLTELVGLAASSALLGSWLAISHLTEAHVNWHLWGILVLLVVWSSLRQSLPGGCLAAAAAAVCALLWAGPGSRLTLYLALQGHLLALCSVALLVGASIGWLRTSEHRYRQVVAHIPAVLYSARFDRPEGLTDLRKGDSPPRAMITLVSPACAALFGCDPDQLLGPYERWLERIHPQDRELVLAALAQLCRQRIPVVCEYRLKPVLEQMKDSEGGGPESSTAESLSLTRESRERWVRDTLAPFYSPEGLLLGWEGVVQEITEQRHLASDLRRLSNMLHALVDNLPAGVFYVQGQTGQPVLVNARARQLLGQREDPSAGITHLPRIYRLHKPDGTLYPWEELPVYKALHRGLTTMRDDIVVHRADGRRIPLITWAAPIDLGTAGAPEAAVWVFEDLSVLHQAEAARLDSEARLRAVFETMGEGLVVQDQTGAIIECNPTACTILGTPAEKLLGQPFPGPQAECWREDGSPLPREEQPDRVSLRTGQPVRNVVLGIPQPPLREGEPTPPVRWILISTMPLLTAQGRPSHQPRLVSTFADITAYRQALRVLQLSEEKYRGLVESLPAVVLQLDRKQRVTYANPMAVEWLRVHPGEAAEAEFWRLRLLEADLKSFLEGQKKVAQGETVRAEVRFGAGSGGPRHGYTVRAPLWHQTEVVGSTLIILDITVQRRMEEAMGRVQRLELVGKVASGVVHDFNNLLTAILNLSILAQQTLPEDHAAAQDLRRIQNAAQEAVQLAGQLLTLGRQRQLQFRPVVVDRIVERTLDLLRSSFPENIQVETCLQAPEDRVLADEGQVQQIIMNLCLNARDAMPQGGRLVLQTAAGERPPNEDKAAELPGNLVAEGRGNPVPSSLPGRELANRPWLRLSVTDSGHGMSPEVCAQIFEAFYTTKERGTGLGLAVVRQLVESFGGRITVSSKPQQGSRFDIWLPLHQGELECWP